MFDTTEKGLQTSFPSYKQHVQTPPLTSLRPRTHESHRPPSECEPMLPASHIPRAKESFGGVKPLAAPLITVYQKAFSFVIRFTQPKETLQPQLGERRCLQRTPAMDRGQKFQRGRRQSQKGP